MKAQSELTMISDTCMRHHPYIRLTTGAVGPWGCRAPLPQQRASLADPVYRAGPLRRTAVKQLHRARMRRIYDIHLRTVMWSAGEMARFRDPDPRCYVTPSYSGGPAMAAVDGKLREPQCFGARGEPWAKPYGTFCTAHDFGAAGGEVVVVRHGEHGFSYRLETA